MTQLKYHKPTEEELKKRIGEAELAQSRQDALIALAKKICDSDDFKMLKVDYGKLLDDEINNLVNIVDEMSFANLGEAAHRGLHKIKYLKQLMGKIEVKAQ